MECARQRTRGETQGTTDANGIRPSPMAAASHWAHPRAHLRIRDRRTAVRHASGSFSTTRRSRSTRTTVLSGSAIVSLRLRRNIRRRAVSDAALFRSHSVRHPARLVISHEPLRYALSHSRAAPRAFSAWRGTPRCTSYLKALVTWGTLSTHMGYSEYSPTYLKALVTWGTLSTHMRYSEYSHAVL